MLRQDAPQLQRALNDAGLKTSDNALQFSLGDQASAQHNPDRGADRQPHRLIVRDDRGTMQNGRNLAGQPWSQRDFIDKVAEVRGAAIAVAIMRGNAELAERMALLEFRDLRRTCVVIQGELGMDDGAIAARTGHSLKTIAQLLEIYMPRTEAMAARGSVAMLKLEGRPAPRKEQQA